jgi:hypothetical protein
VPLAGLRTKAILALLHVKEAKTPDPDVWKFFWSFEQSIICPKVGEVDDLSIPK